MSSALGVCNHASGNRSRWRCSQSDPRKKTQCRVFFGREFGFGNYFIQTIKTLYFNGNCSIKLRAGTSPRFNLNRGITQGCPISPYLFLLCSQLLADSINQSTLRGITVADNIITISQLADDTTYDTKNAL